MALQFGRKCLLEYIDISSIIAQLPRRIQRAQQSYKQTNIASNVVAFYHL